MLQHVPRLVRLYALARSPFFKVVCFLVALASLASTAVAGDLAFGTRGAIAAPLVTLVAGLLFFHIAVRMAISLGLRAHARGQHGPAMATLWLTQVRWLRAYDRRGRVSTAFHASKAQVGAQMMQRFAAEMLRGRGL